MVYVLKKFLQGTALALFLTSQLQAQMYSQEQNCCPCECEKKITFSADYLCWKLEDSPRIIPLVATAPVIHNGDPVIGQPGAKVVLGGKHLSNDWRSGAKFGLGYHLANEICSSVEASYFFLPQDTRHHKVFSSGAAGTPYLAVPYYDTVTDLESSSPVARPGRFRGLAKLHFSNWMQGAELNAWADVYHQCRYSLSGMIGFRYWSFNDKVRFLVDSPQVGVPNDIYRVRDRFSVLNNFYAGQIGVGIKGGFEQFFLDVKGKVALGAMREKSSVRGDFVTNSFTGFTVPETFNGGYFALRSNIGTHKRTRFAVMSEFDFNFGYHLYDCLDLRLGYTFIYVDEVLWASKQLNRRINPTQSVLYEFTPTPAAIGRREPRPRLRSDSLWVQGITVGIEYRF